MKKADFILIAVVLCAAIIASALLYSLAGNGAYVSVEVDGQTVEELPLDTDTVYDIKTDSGYNMLVIEDGCAYMLEADCPDGICVSHSKISKNGESIICLPHRVIVTVENGEKAEADL